MRITKSAQIMNGHRVVEFEDGSQRVFMRGKYDDLDLEVGDYFPPLTGAESYEAMQRRVEGRLRREGFNGPDGEPKDNNIGIASQAEVSNAVERGNEEVESGKSSLGQQEGSEGQESVSSSGDNVEREASGEEGQEGISSKEVRRSFPRLRKILGE